MVGPSIIPTIAVMPHRSITWPLLLLWLIPAAAASGAQLGSDAYTLPLIGRYAVNRLDLHFPNKDSGTHQLKEITDPQTGGGVFLIEHLQRVAVLHSFILGQTATGYFLFDTRHPDTLPQQFMTKEAWNAALQQANLSPNPQLSNPDTLAAALPDQVLHPWNYRVMHNRLGFSDGAWSLVVQIAGFVIAFALGLFARSSGSAFTFAVGLGVVVDIVAQIYVVGGGPGAFVGFVIFPLYYCLAVWIARGVRWLAFTVRRPLPKSRPIG
jgi:hypothetical protein